MLRFDTLYRFIIVIHGVTSIWGEDQVEEDFLNNLVDDHDNTDLSKSGPSCVDEGGAALVDSKGKFDFEINGEKGDNGDFDAEDEHSTEDLILKYRQFFSISFLIYFLFFLSQKDKTPKFLLKHNKSQNLKDDKDHVSRKTTRKLTRNN